MTNDEISNDETLTRLFNNRGLLLLSLMLFALILNREGDRVPSGNELVYLLYFYKGWHPQFLATDWTFQEPSAGHAVFNHAVGWLAVLFSLETAAWIGRVLCWFGIFSGLFRLGRHISIPNWAVWLGIVFWLLQGQSLVTTEWMVGTFEAKDIAYICLLFALDGVMTGNVFRAGVLCGLAFSFHSAVGMWGGAAVGVATLVNYPIRKTIQFSCLVILFSLPGLITSWKLIAGPDAINEAEARYLTTVALPGCFDPFTFPRTWIALLLTIPVFTILFAWWQRDNRPMRILGVFQITLAFFFLLGILFRAAGRFGLVQLFPMRVHSVFAMLLLFWQLAWMIFAFVSPVSSSGARSSGRAGRPSAFVLIFGLLLMFTLPSPVLRLRDMLDSHLPRLRELATRHLSSASMSNSSSGSPSTDLTHEQNDQASFRDVARWVADPKHTAVTDVVIAPPWTADGFYFIRRPLVANWHAPRYNRMNEWKDRIESLVGSTSTADGLENITDGGRNYYNALSPDQIEKIRHDYGGKWLITAGKYIYPLAYSAGDYSVYRLP